MPILTQSVTVGGVTSGGDFGTITKVGTSAITNFQSGVQRTTLNFVSVNPGDLLVCILGGGNGSVPADPTAIGSAGSSGWEEILAPNYDPTLGGGVGMWYGQVTTAQSDVLNASWAFGSGTTWLSLYQFTSGQGANTVWTVDKSDQRVNTSSTTITFPTLVPTGTGELYVGGAASPTTASNGATSGYSYHRDSTNTFINCWHTSIGASTSPTAATSPATTSPAAGALFRAQAPSASVNTAQLTVSHVPTGRMWVVSQMGFEILPVSILTTIVVTVTLNGRILYGRLDGNGGYVQGPPFITIRSGDLLTFEWQGAPVGSSAIVNLFYNEYDAMAQPRDIGGLV